MTASLWRLRHNTENCLLISLLAGSPTRKINDLDDILAAVATAIGDSFPASKTARRDPLVGW
jgi:hypothetical protein